MNLFYKFFIQEIVLRHFLEKKYELTITNRSGDFYECYEECIQMGGNIIQQNLEYDVDEIHK